MKLYAIKWRLTEEYINKNSDQHPTTNWYFSPYNELAFTEIEFAEEAVRQARESGYWNHVEFKIVTMVEEKQE